MNFTTLPDTKGVVIVLSGGLDSTAAMRFCVEKYGKENVAAISFDYGQKQAFEIEMANASTLFLGVRHKVLDLRDSLGDFALGMSANVDKDIAMPTIQEVIGDPTPKTYVPNRNMILLSMAAAYAEKLGYDTIVTGLQATDNYNYWDTTPDFIAKMNDVFSENRKVKVKLIAPFAYMTKEDEIKAVQLVDGNVKLLGLTLTCYNPRILTDFVQTGDMRVQAVRSEVAFSCGTCPSCAERIQAFMKAGLRDPVPYAIDIKWPEHV